MKIFTIIVFVFAVALLIPALLMALGQTGWLYSFDRAAYKDRKAYGKFIAKILLMIAGVFCLSGILSLFMNWIAPAIVLAVGFIAVLVYASKKATNYYR